MKSFVLIGAVCCAAAVVGCKRGPELEGRPPDAQSESGGPICEQEPADGAAGEKGVTMEASGDFTAAGGAIALFPQLEEYVDSILPEMEAIPAERKRQLKKIALFVQTKLRSGEPANLLFICTHNSRRSHMGQLWAAAAASYYGIGGVRTFSGGLEATAFDPRAVAAMGRAGFEVESPGGENPHYRVTYSENAPAQECFSKKYDDPFNPSENFAAIMTCSHADRNCPAVEGAVLRVSIPYEDPKASEGTPQEGAAYDERARQIATEMFYLFSQVRA